MDDDLDAWKERIRRATDDELLALQEASLVGLSGPDPEHWKTVIRVTEEEMRQRGLLR